MPRADGEAAIRLRLGRPRVFLLCLAPLLVLAWRIGSNDLGPNPVEAVLHFTGLWALRMLLVTLALTPLRRLTGLPWLLRFRRMLGLFAFFYAVLHFVAYLVLDRALVWEEILRDLTERSYIALGFLALILLLPLAITSTRGWMRRPVVAGNSFTGWSTSSPSLGWCTSSGWSRQTFRSPSSMGSCLGDSWPLGCLGRVWREAGWRWGLPRGWCADEV